MEKNYHDNENIKLKKKRGRPKKIQPTPVPLTEQEVLEQWVKDNREFFFNHNRKTREDLGKVYTLYNII